MTILGRPREFDRERALEAAMMVFWRKGFLGSSMNDLCDAMGIRSPSLYAAFGSKEQLYVEAVELYNAAARTLIWNRIDDGPTVRAGMKKVLYAAADVLTGGAGAPPGCLVTLAAGEDAPGAVPEIARAGRLQGMTVLREGLERAVAAGELPRSADLDRLSRFYVGVVQGIAIQARDGASRAEMEGTADTAMVAWPPGPAARRRKSA